MSFDIWSVRMASRSEAWSGPCSLLVGARVDMVGHPVDGSLTLYAGAKSPGKDKEANWLPAPDGAFSLYLRAYWPEEAVLNGQWKPPIVRHEGGL